MWLLTTHPWLLLYLLPLLLLVWSARLGSYSLRRSPLLWWLLSLCALPAGLHWWLSALLRIGPVAASLMPL